MPLLKPVTIETIAMTVATPTTMPSTVSVARSLCARPASMAKRMFSAKPRRKWEIRLLIAQRLHGRQLARLIRGDPAGHDARHRRDGHAEEDEREFDLRREELFHRQRDENADDDADDSPDRRKQRGLEEKLPADVAPPRPERPPNADLL